MSDGVQEILGADVIANRAVGHCGVEQRSYRRRKSMVNTGEIVPIPYQVSPGQWGTA